MPNALSAQPNQLPAQAQQAPAPNHAQTVAALRHFYMIGKELRGLLADPNVGKSDIRSALIESGHEACRGSDRSADRSRSADGELPG